MAVPLSTLKTLDELEGRLGAYSGVVVSITRELLGRIRELTRRINELERQISSRVEPVAPALLAL